MFSELGGASLRMLGSLIAVIGVILVLFYLARRLRFRNSFQSPRIPQMRLLGTLNVAPKRSLALVEFSDQWLILGIGAESVRLITQMNRPPVSEQEAFAPRQKGKSFQDFFTAAGLLQQWRKPAASRKEDAPQ